MPLSKTPDIEPEILSPAAQLRLTAWEAKQEDEAAQLTRLEALAKLMDALSVSFLGLAIQSA